jgi:hypothetical protein
LFFSAFAPLFSSALTQLFSSIFAQSSPRENAVALRQVSPSPSVITAFLVAPAASAVILNASRAMPLVHLV